MTVIEKPLHPRVREYYKRWLHVTLYSILLLAGQSTATLLGRLYFDKGGKSKWMSTFVQSAGFPILLPFFWYYPTPLKSTNDSSNTKLKFTTLFYLYLAFGLLLIGNDLMYSYGLLYLPLSTYALLCATQLAFNALFTFFLNSQKIALFTINSIVLLTISVSLLAINANSEDKKGVPKEMHIIGFLCTLAASATFSLHHSLVQLCFEKVIKTETFSVVLDMQFYPSFIATCGCFVRLFLSGEWKIVEKDIKEFESGRLSYLMTLFWSAVTWQISCIGMLGLIFEVSSLFSVVIGTLELPIAPFLAFMVFHDKMTGVKIIALLLAIRGFMSYMYQHYLDDQKAKKINVMTLRFQKRS